eukprot:5774699-Alexandrium_andersonii.AAC.1
MQQSEERVAAEGCLLLSDIASGACGPGRSGPFSFERFPGRSLQFRAVPAPLGLLGQPPASEALSGISSQTFVAAGEARPPPFNLWQRKTKDRAVTNSCQRMAEAAFGAGGPARQRAFSHLRAVPNCSEQPPALSGAFGQLRVKSDVAGSTVGR